MSSYYCQIIKHSAYKHYYCS